MNLKTKRIIILILDILIAILGGFSFYETNEIQNINIKYTIILTLLVIIRIFVDFKIETDEEKSYKLDQEIMLLKKKHEIDRLTNLSRRAIEALSAGNTKEFINIESLIGK
jgi:hypothetical protein